MSEKDILLNLAKNVRRATLQRLESAETQWMTFAPTGTSNHLAWHAGHVLWVQDYLCVEPLTGKSDLKSSWAEQFGINCNPVRNQTEWPEQTELLELLTKQDQRLQALLSETSNERFAEVADSSRGEATIADRIMHGLLDEAKHCGEMHLLIKICKAG